jgi:TRAP-type C4-dicarboxylate transport system permease small subunit
VTESPLKNVPQPQPAGDGTSPNNVGPTYSLVEKGCLALSQVAILILIAVVGIDVLTRSLLNYSFEVADELGGYMLVVIAFFSLAVCQAHDGFHRVEFVLDNLSARARIVARIIYDAVALALALLLAWHLLGFVSNSWTSGAEAPTRLMTPLWLVQLPMVLGMVAYVVSLSATIVRYAALLGTMPHNSGRTHDGR